jgi:hypothetical protein
MEKQGCYVGHSILNRMSVVPDGIGLIALGLQAYLMFRWLMPDDGSRLPVGILAFILLATCAFYMWYSEKMTQKICDLGGWGAAVGVSVFLGALSFGCDMLVGIMNYPGLSPFKAATKVGSPFGFGLTVILCGFTMVAIAGFVRALVLRSESDQPSTR